MVHVARVTELMEQKVAHDLRSLKQQAAIQAHGTAYRAAAPARALAANLCPFERQPRVTCEALEPGNQRFARSRDEPRTKHVLQTGNVRPVAPQLDGAWSDHLQPRCFQTCPPVPLPAPPGC